MFTSKYASVDHVRFIILEDVRFKALSTNSKGVYNSLAKDFIDRLNLSCIFTLPSCKFFPWLAAASGIIMVNSDGSRKDDSSFNLTKVRGIKGVHLALNLWYYTIY